jgi:hypothetical protein
MGLANPLVGTTALAAVNVLVGLPAILEPFFPLLDFFCS